MTLSEQLLTIAGPSWQRALGMRFITEVSDDSVADEVFARYLLLERNFVDVAARVLGGAIMRAPARAALEGHLGTLNALVDDQYGYFDAMLGAAGQVGVRALAQADGLARQALQVAAAGSYPQIVACMLPSEKLYDVWCARAAARPSRRPAIAEWVRMHAEPPFTDRVAFLAGEVDALHVGQAQIAELGALVGQVLDLECRFHDAAYIEDLSS